MRILLAEDEHTLGTWLCKALEHAGIQVEWVDDGRLADRALQQRDHDALVLDLGLPGMDGHTVLQRLRERDQRLPALILTARDSLSERAVLRALVQRSGEPLSKQQILERVFSDDDEVHLEAVEVLVYRLRKRLDGSGVRIVTLRGLGYVLEAD